MCDLGAFSDTINKKTTSILQLSYDAAPLLKGKFFSTDLVGQNDLTSEHHYSNKQALVASGWEWDGGTAFAVDALL